MSSAASNITSDRDPFAAGRAAEGHDDLEDGFRGRILAAMRDLRARERRASRPDLGLGDAANDDGAPASGGASRDVHATVAS